MKKLILIITILSLLTTSCLKKRTCTCKDASGKVVSQTTTKSNNVKDFEDKCKKTKTVETTSSGSTSTPCELS
ncbi:MAG: hypothetical protein SFY56_01005 [Bacteroidota bacterium]|nr:hypothetical protein [Bacteroidota bacterium]